MRLVKWTWAFATVAASLAWTACSAAGPATVQIEAGKSFSLKVGESATVAGGTLRVGFDGVTADSRCPKGEQCLIAGAATLRVWLQPAANPRVMRDLQTAPAAAQAVRAVDHELRLLRLDPLPVTGKLLANSDYTATLTLNRSAAAEAER